MEPDVAARLAPMFFSDYVLNPFDLVPDFIPLVGQIDDAAVVAACLLMVRQDLHRYKKWKIANPE